MLTCGITHFSAHGLDNMLNDLDQAAEGKH